MDKKTAVILHHTLNIRGGGEIIPLEIARILKEHCAFRRVLLVTLDQPNKITLDRFCGKLKFIDKAVHLFKKSRPITIKLEFAKNLIGLYKSFKDAYIFNTAGLTNMDELSNLVYVHNPFLFTELIESESPAERFYGLFNLAVGKLTNRCFSARVKTIYACNSKYTANLLNKFFNKYGKTNATITTLYPPVDVNHIKKKGKERIRQNAVVVLSRFHPKKKLEFSLFVAKEVVKKIPQAKFYLIGSLNDAHYYSYLKTLALKLGLHRHVSFLADVSEEVKATLMHSAKVYLHTMPYEHFGISIVEGMSAGLCPIVHDSGGAKEFVDSKYRYTNLTEAVEKVTYYLENWNYEDSEKLKSKAQLFDRTNFEANFLKILKKLM